MDITGNVSGWVQSNDFFLLADNRRGYSVINFWTITNLLKKDFALRKKVTFYAPLL